MDLKKILFDPRNLREKKLNSQN